MRRLLFGHDVTVATWAGKKLDVIFYPPYWAVGVLGDDGSLIGAAIFNCHSGANVDLSFVGDHAGYVELWRAMADIAFNHLKALRITARTRRRNKKLIAVLPRLGWKHEGVQEQYYGPTRADAAFVFGMTRNAAVAAKWIRKTVR